MSTRDGFSFSDFARLVVSGRPRDIDQIEAILRVNPKWLDPCLSWAIEQGYIDVVEISVKLGARIRDEPGEDGKVHITVLGALNSPFLGASFLGADPFLVLAARSGHARMVETLVRLGSQALDTPGVIGGRTPIMWAAIRGHSGVLETLVRLGSRALDTPDRDGRTPLAWAARNGHLFTLRTLVRLGSRALDTPDGNSGDASLRVNAQAPRTPSRSVSASPSNPGDHLR